MCKVNYILQNINVFKAKNTDISKNVEKSALVSKMSKTPYVHLHLGYISSI